MIVTVNKLDFTARSAVREILFDWMLECPEDSRDAFETALNSGLRDKVHEELETHYAGIGDVSFALEDDELYTLYKSYA